MTRVPIKFHLFTTPYVGTPHTIQKSRGILKPYPYVRDIHVIPTLPESVPTRDLTGI